MARLLDPLCVVMILIGAALVSLGRVRVEDSAQRKRKRAGLVLGWLGWALAYLASSSNFSSGLVHHFEAVGADLEAKLGAGEHPAIAMVVLSGAPRTNNLSYPYSERIDASSQARVLAAARVEQRYHVGAIIVTGAPPLMATGMKELLERLGVPGDKIKEETQATSTEENAKYCAPILKELGAHTIVLVTSALHLHRASAFFEREGFEVLGAPADPQTFDNASRNTLSDFLPSSDTLSHTDMALHEVFGRIKQRAH